MSNLWGQVLTEHQVGPGDNKDDALRVVLGAVPDYIHYGTTDDEMRDILNHVVKAVHVMGNNVRRHDEDMVPVNDVQDIVIEAVNEAINPSYIDDLITKLEKSVKMKEGPAGPQGLRGNPGDRGHTGPSGENGMNNEEKKEMQEQLERLKDIEMQIQDILEEL